MSMALSMEGKKAERFNAYIGLFKKWLYTQTERLNSQRCIIIKSFVFWIKNTIMSRVLRICRLLCGVLER